MNNKEIMDYAEEAIIHTYNRFPVVLDHGDGVYLYDVEGKKYLDFAAGIAVCAFGYNVKEYNDALKAQIDKMIHVSNLYYTQPAALKRCSLPTVVQKPLKVPSSLPVSMHGQEIMVPQIMRSLP